MVFVAVFGGIMLVTHGENFGVALVLALATLSVITVIRKALPRCRTPPRTMRLRSGARSARPARTSGTSVW